MKLTTQQQHKKTGNDRENDKKRLIEMLKE